MVDHYDGSTGQLVVSIPDDAIDACTHPGPCDDDVAYWEPKCTWHADRSALENICRETGAWDRAEIADMDDGELRQRVLWLACGDEKDYAWELERR